MAWRGPRGRSCDLLPRMQKLSWLHRREVDLTIPPLWSPPVPSVSWPNSKSGREPFDQVQTGQASRTQSWWWAGSGSLGLHWRQRVHYVRESNPPVLRRHAQGCFWSTPTYPHASSLHPTPFRRTWWFQILWETYHLLYFLISLSQLCLELGEETEHKWR